MLNNEFEKCYFLQFLKIVINWFCLNFTSKKHCADMLRVYKIYPKEIKVLSRQWRNKKPFN